MADPTKKPKQMVAYDKFDIDGWNGELFDEDYCSDKTLDDILDNALQDLTSCEYCSTKLLRVEEYVDEGNSYRNYCLWYCRGCRFWQARFYSDPLRDCIPPPDFHAYISKLREFNGDLPEGCNEELASHIKQCPDLLHSFNPARFEKFVADVFRANCTNAEVLHIGKPRDGGIDVLLIETGSEQWLIQVKRRGSQKSSEGVSTIRELFGTMFVEGKRIGIVVSTVERFSPDAQEIVAKAKKRGGTVELVDKGIFDKMLDPILPDRPWLDPISQFDWELAQHLADRIPSDTQLDLFEPQPFQLI